MHGPEGMTRMNHFSRIVVALSFATVVGGAAVAAGNHHHQRSRKHGSHHTWRHYSWRHRGRHAWGPAVDARTSVSAGIFWPSARYLQDRDRDWWTYSDWTTHVAVDVNRDSSWNLDQFGTGKIAVADLVRFTKPSMVVGRTEAAPHGISGGVKQNWSAEDQLKEGQFIADYQSMLLRSFRDESK